MLRAGLARCTATLIQLVQPHGVAHLRDLSSSAGHEVIAELQAHDVRRCTSASSCRSTMNRALLIDPQTEAVL